MKFYNTSNKNVKTSGAILVTDNGEIYVAENADILAMLDRLAPKKAGEWVTESIKCGDCGESWCEIHKKSQQYVICPECHEELELL